MDLSGEADVILLVREYEPEKIVAFSVAIWQHAVVFRRQTTTTESS